MSTTAAAQIAPLSAAALEQLVEDCYSLGFAHAAQGGRCIPYQCLPMRRIISSVCVEDAKVLVECGFGAGWLEG